MKNERNRAWRRFKNKVTIENKHEEMDKDAKSNGSLRKNGKWFIFELKNCLEQNNWGLSTQEKVLDNC